MQDKFHVIVSWGCGMLTGILFFFYCCILLFISTIPQVVVHACHLNWDWITCLVLQLNRVVNNCRNKLNEIRYIQCVVQCV